jgi:ankyrin repeat protein
MVLPPELVPKRKIPFPTVHDWDSVRITLRRTGCFGSCPSYRVEVHGDGTVLYEGQAFVAVTGSHRGSIAKETVVELVNAFRDADYYSLQDEYVWDATDLPTFETSIEIDGRLKRVEDYAGGQIGMPLTVSKLEAEIDRLADTGRWTKGNENTARSLTEEKWDFKTPEAAETLARVVQSGNSDAVRDLVAGGVPLDANSKSASLTLAQAARRGDMSMLRALLDAGAGKNPQAMDTALVMAASTGKVEVVRALIGYGASPNSADRSGRTLLMAAAASGVPAVVEQVLSFNPDVNGRGAQGRTALMEAVGQWHYGPERAEVNRAAVARLLLEHGADPNLQDEKGNTTLIGCAWDADAALALIRHGANVNAQNNDGLTPLINTAVAEVARVLIENGADLYLRDKEGKTALEQAKQYGMKEKAAAIEGAQGHKQ